MKSTLLAIALCFALRGLCSASDFNGRTGDPVSLVAPFFINNSEFKSAITVSNRTGTIVDTNLLFKSLEAEEVGHASLELRPYSSVVVDLDSIAMRMHRFGDLGSVYLTTNGAGADNRVAHVTITSTARGTDLHIEEKFQPVRTKPRVVQVASAAFFSTPVLAIHSSTRFSQTVIIDCITSQRKSYESEMTLPPGMTFLVNACINHRAESRSYLDILRGKGRENTKEPMSVRVKVVEDSGSIAVWGLASAGPTAPLIARGIDFGESEVGLEFSK